MIYRIFKDKEEIYQAVFIDWLVSRRSAANQAATGRGGRQARLYGVCHLLAIEPWAEMVRAPMGRNFLKDCEQIDPDSKARYREVMHECVMAILDDPASTEVFLLALDGLFADQLSMNVLEKRTQLLVERFAPRSSRENAKS